MYISWYEININNFTCLLGVKLGERPQAKNSNTLRHVHPVVLSELSSS